MVSFIHISDLHLGYKQYGLQERFRDYAQTFSRIADTTIREGLKLMLVSGDLFHTKSINPDTYHQALSVLQKLKDAGVQVVVIEGNHDTAPSSRESSWLSILETQGLVRLLKLKADDGMGVKLMGDYVDIDDARIFGVRYIGYSTKKEVESIASEIRAVNDKLGKPKTTILLMHFGIEGALGREISGEVPLGALGPLKDVVDYLALGHYHVQYDRDGWVFNPGSPDLVSMDEYGKPKGMYIYRDGNLEFKQTWKGIRNFIRVRVDVSSAVDVTQLRATIDTEVAKECKGAPEGSIAMVDLIGKMPVERVSLNLEDWSRELEEANGLLLCRIRVRVAQSEGGITDRDALSLARHEVEHKVFNSQVAAHPVYSKQKDTMVNLVKETKDNLLTLSRDQLGPEGVKLYDKYYEILAKDDPELWNEELEVEETIEDQKKAEEDELTEAGIEPNDDKKGRWF